MPNDILKRLDIIKNAVAMEEDDLIAMQVQKLEKLPLDEQVQHILALIRAQQFQGVIQLIEQYKHDSSGLTVYEDPQIQGLKLELKLLENRLNELTDTQAEIEREINEFNDEYSRRLGNLIKEILKSRTELCSNDAEKQQAKQDYEEFERGYQQQEALQTKIAVLREKISIFELNIENLQADEAYQLILSIDDMDDYFSKLESELKAEIKVLHSSIIQKQLSAVEQGLASVKQPSAQKIIAPEPIVSTPSQKIGKFIVQDGIATDTETGLIWLRFVHGQHWENGDVAGDAKMLSWNEAMNLPDIFNQQGYAGYKDWRVPTIDELETFTIKNYDYFDYFDYIKIFCNSYENAFRDEEESNKCFWSSSLSNDEFNVDVYFDNSYSHYGYRGSNGKYNYGVVRLVCGGL